MDPIPTINVNTKPCPSQKWHDSRDLTPVCRGECAPVLIPCPIQRSVTIEVALGECVCGHAAWVVRGNISIQHDANCHARPIRVSCSIGGKTWAESEVTDIEPNTDPDGDDWGDAMWNACRARWKIVKALVTGRATTLEDVTSEPMSTLHMNGMLAQRDAMFAALAELAQIERGHSDISDELDKMEVEIYGGHDHYPRVTQATRRLEYYVKHLIDQIANKIP